ncbi:flavoprotein [Streptomyces sp. NPDC003032]
MRPVLHLVGCGTRPIGDLPEFAAALRADGWGSYVITSPTGRLITDIAAAGQCSGLAVRWEIDPDDPVELLTAQAVVVAPAAFNTIKKLAAGIADTLSPSPRRHWGQDCQ